MSLSSYSCRQMAFIVFPESKIWKLARRWMITCGKGSVLFTSLLANYFWGNVVAVSNRDKSQPQRKTFLVFHSKLRFDYCIKLITRQSSETERKISFRLVVDRNSKKGGSDFDKSLYKGSNLLTMDTTAV